jgi:hypothetical protein
MTLRTQINNNSLKKSLMNTQSKITVLAMVALSFVLSGKVTAQMMKEKQ